MKLLRQIGRASNQKRVIDPILPRKDTQDNIKTIIKKDDNIDVQGGEGGGLTPNFFFIFTPPPLK